VVEPIERRGNVDAAKRINRNLEHAIMQTELRNYHPSARDRTEWWLRDSLYGRRRLSPIEEQHVGNLMALLDFPVGTLLGVNEAAGTTAAGVANRSPLQMAEGLGLAALAAVPIVGRKLQGPVRRALRDIGAYDPPIVSQRPFEDDYRRAIPADAHGRLTHDIDGRPINAKWVVGRRMAGEIDEPFPRWELDALAKALTGRRARTVPQHVLGENLAGGVRPSGQIDLSADLTPLQRPRIYEHELGHIMDDASRISDKGLEQELVRVFNDLNNPYPDLFKVTPELRGYPAAEVPREYMAEARRAYLANPNYIKTVAPNTAAAIRAAWNANPYLSRIIHLNSALAPVAAAGLLRSPEGESNEGERKKGTGGGRIDLSDLPPSDGLPTEEWMKRRNQQMSKPRR
jgi:hypothetical protein